MLSAEEIKYNLKTQQQSDNGHSDEEYTPFYDIKWKLKDNEDGEREIREIKINYFKLVNLLKSLGFRRLDIGRQSFIVRVEDNLVEEVTQQKVIDTFIDWLNEQGGANLPDGVMKEALIDKIYKSIGTYFSDNLLNRLRSEKPISFNEHSRDQAFFYYQNGFVKVTAESITLHPYSELHCQIWRNQILPRSFKPMLEQDCTANTFVQFCKNISNNWLKHPQSGKKQQPDRKRYEDFKSILGYCLHGYHEGKLRAIILTDSRISEEASGRTGKTLICKSLGHMLNADKLSKTYVELNGKDFDTSDRFKYQELAVDTKLVHINDVGKKFSFEDLFNDITEGIKCQRKNEMPFPVMCKMVISTNRTIRIHGDSAKDRSIEFEMADYYGAEWSPEMEFGQWFFRDWEEKDWHCFDNFMLQCVQLFLQKGLQRPGAINLLTRKLHEETAIEFVAFMEDQEIQHRQEFEKKMMLHDFKERYEDFKDLKQKTFTKWLRTWGDFHPDFGGTEESRRGGADYIRFFWKTPPEPTAPAEQVQDEEDIPWLKD